MPINAREKFTNAISSRLENYQLVSERAITDLDELGHILKTATGYGYSLIPYKDCLVEASAYEYCYDNGFKYLVSEIVYEKNKNIHTIEQRTLTTDYHNAPIVNVTIEREKKAISQLLITSSSQDDIFPEAMKDIEIEKTGIHVDNYCGSVFETYEGYDTLILEKYMQYYPILDYENPNDLLRLCGCGTRYLEIIYHNYEPIYAQLSDKYNVEMAGFNSNSKVDAKKIVKRIDEEVDAIVANIHSSLEREEKQHRYVKQ